MIQSFFCGVRCRFNTFISRKNFFFYQVPVAVYSDQASQIVTKMSEVAHFWKKGIKPYEAQNILRAVPKMLSEEQLSKTLFTANVLWTNYNKNDKIVSEETNFYILSQSKEEFKIFGLIIMAK